MRRTRQLGILVSPAEKAALKRLAEVEGGLSQAALVRRLIRKEAKRHGFWPPEAEAQSRGAYHVVADPA